MEPLPEHALSRLADLAAKPLMDLDMDELPRLDKYRLVRELGRGGMGVVYEAEDPELNRRVAIKVLHGARSHGDSVRIRFQREAQSMAGVPHPNVVMIHDVGESEERAYIVMELVTGGSLSEVLSRRSHDMPRLLGMLVKVGRGLGAAHAKGIVHRDLKPGNILIADDGSPKVADFGLAHWVSSEMELTKSGSTVGTPHYMAPEQADGRIHDITPATDVYGLGAILYEVLTGRPPHTGFNVMEVSRRILDEDPIPPRKINAKVHPEVEAICLMALEKEPAKRYESADAFAADLENHLKGESVRARAPGPATRLFRWARKHRTMSAVSGVVLLSALVTAGLLVGQAARRAGEERRELDGHLVRGRTAKAEYEKHLRQILSTEDRRCALREDRSQKMAVWDVERELERLREEAAVLYSDMVLSFTSALAVDGANREARSALAELYFGEFEEALFGQDSEAVNVKEKLVRFYDDGVFAPRLEKRGWLSIETRPPGARIRLFRYEEGPDRRLAAREEEDPGASPLKRMVLPSGSWLLVLSLPGYRDVRYPVHIGRATEHEAVVNLYTEEQIGSDFVYVPGGPFISGGAGAKERSVVTLPDYFISRFEVTCGQYLEFLNDREYHSAGDAQKFVPQFGRKFGQIWQLKGKRYRIGGVTREQPLSLITWGMAKAYCTWLNSRSDGFVYRMPSVLQWEKAARGVDGRTYPWGHHFDWSFTAGRQDVDPRKELRIPKAGEYEKDESPYGVRDMAGGMQEFCELWFDEALGLRPVCGGSYRKWNSNLFRCAAVSSVPMHFIGPGFGFRVVKVPKK